MRIVIGLTLLLLSSITSACQCAGVPVEITDENADYIYLGKIVSAKITADGKVENTLKPIDILRGNPDQWKFLSSQGPVRMCKAMAAVGLRYIVYGRYGELPELYLCSNTRHYNPKSSPTLEEIRATANK